VRKGEAEASTRGVKMDDATRKVVADVVRRCREGGYEVSAWPAPFPTPPAPHQRASNVHHTTHLRPKTKRWLSGDL
jgi:hypothetical protein